ncbi:MAG TPA: MATE family efflux transporter [Exilispira sp.]|nr:MATE family efflux transporter [Spirochaetota bacterium]NLJ05369.1 MATE family efflux transporter [Exilispira sp.]HOV46531.1 MATE family efflux transporter [Exilispira sp.]HQQ19198.1 MATE family efflux transporter [Exilispira sp.]
MDIEQNKIEDLNEQIIIDKKNDLTTGKTGEKIINFTIPLLIGNIFQQAYNVVDSIVVGRFVGKEALAAVGANFPIINLTIAIVMGITLGISILLSQYIGAKKTESARKTVDTAYIFICITAVITSIAGFFCGRSILILLNTPLEILDDAIIYNKIIFAGLIFMFGYNTVSSLMRGIGDSKTPTVLLIIATLINIVLDLVFVLIFKLGVKGVAIATIIAQAISFFAGILILTFKKSIIAPHVKKIEFDLSILSKSLKLGLPSGIQQALVAFGFMALLRIVNGFGTDVTAAYTAAGRIDSFACMPITSFSMAITTFVAQNVGAKKIDRVMEGVKKTLIYSIVASVVIGVCIIIFSSQLMSIFTTDKTVQSIGKNYIFIVASFYIFFAIMFTFNGALRGSGETVIPMLNSIISLWILRVPCSYLLSKIIGTNGIWWGIPIAWFFGAILAFYHFQRGKWREKKVI